MKHPLDNITKVRYIVGIDLGGTLVNETAPELLPIPEHIIAQTGMDETTLSYARLEPSPLPPGGIIVLRRELVDNKLLISQSWETESMIIRDANLQDVDRLQEIYLQSRSTEGWTRDDELTADYILNGVNKGNLPPNGIKEFYKIQLITHKNSSEIMGFIEYYHGYPDKEVLYIGTLLFSEDYRNNGYGQEIMNELFKQALELGFQQARLGVTLKNWQGIYFWTKLGFNKILKFRGDKVLAKDSFALLELGKDL